MMTNEEIGKIVMAYTSGKQVEAFPWTGKPVVVNSLDDLMCHIKSHHHFRIRLVKTSSKKHDVRYPITKDVYKQYYSFKKDDEHFTLYAALAMIGFKYFEFQNEDEFNACSTVPVRIGKEGTIVASHVVFEEENHVVHGHS